MSFARSVDFLFFLHAQILLIKWLVTAGEHIFNWIIAC